MRFSACGGASGGPNARAMAQILNDFAEALAYVNGVGALAEKADHPPDIDIRWNRVTLRLSTHSAGALTQKDLDLAGAIDAFGKR